MWYDYLKDINYLTHLKRDTKLLGYGVDIYRCYLQCVCKYPNIVSAYVLHYVNIIHIHFWLYNQRVHLYRACYNYRDTRLAHSELILPKLSVPATDLAFVYHFIILVVIECIIPVPIYAIDDHCTWSCGAIVSLTKYGLRVRLPFNWFCT